MVDTFSMQIPKAVCHRVENLLSSCLKNETVANGRPQILSAIQQSCHEPATVKGAPNTPHASTKDLDGRNAAAAHFFRDRQLSKRPRRPSKKNPTQQMVKQPSVLVGADQRRITIAKLKPPYFSSSLKWGGLVLIFMASLRAFLDGKKLCDILSDDHQGLASINHFFESRRNNPPCPISRNHTFPISGTSQSVGLYFDAG